jgi:hypothetical protein
MTVSRIFSFNSRSWWWSHSKEAQRSHPASFLLVLERVYSSIDEHDVRSARYGPCVMYLVRGKHACQVMSLSGRAISSINIDARKIGYQSLIGLE